MDGVLCQVSEKVGRIQMIKTQPLEMEYVSSRLRHGGMRECNKNKIKNLVDANPLPSPLKKKKRVSACG